MYSNVRICNLSDIEDILLYQGVLAFEYFTQQNIDEETREVMRKALKES